MRIALRTGAGRGAYELTGTHGTYSASQLFNKEMVYELTPNLIIPGYSVPALRQGKPRITLNEEPRRLGLATHFYRLLAAVLLLPRPKREFRTTEGRELIDDGYSITAIKIDIAAIESFRVVVRPTEILLESDQGFRESLNFIDRMSRIMAVWDAANTDDSELSLLLRKHQAALEFDEISHVLIEKAARNIFGYLQTAYDPLPEIESRLGVDRIQNIEKLLPGSPLL